MAKTSRRTNSRNRNTQKIQINTVKPVATNKAQLATQLSDMGENAKRDLKWGAFTALIVIVVLLILYFLFH
jgi:hypothetical protein